MSTTWKDIVKDWEKVPVEAYKFLFSQAKDRYDEFMSESESITNKAITLTTITVAAISGFVSYKFTASPNKGFVVLLTFLFLGDLFCLGKLLFPKRITQRGSPPNEIFIDYLDNNELEEDDKTKLVYYHELKRYQENMDMMEKRNSVRHWFYGIALCLTIIATVITAGIILSTIYHP
ncbi:hypothetical protein OCK74_21915 [Chitinophagaceae bacterium LB-8]|uniref:Uncharacterized protein n=1 Tax=Paraflavisolibacter caeni TaxID=2982496 RepID=A0A9X2Y1R5_9BACT|nr:hypothetical protein [Paraflavisolibacter caeni]MCU7551793.1 hypothetical protein [Paraflavisolibacter caeni]